MAEFKFSVSEAQDVDQRLMAFRRLLEDVHLGIEYALKIEEARQANSAKILELKETIAHLEQDIVHLQRNIDEFNKQRDDLAGVLREEQKKAAEIKGDLNRQGEEAKKKLKEKEAGFEARMIDLDKQYEAKQVELEKAHQARAAELDKQIAQKEERLKIANFEIENIIKKANALKG